MRHLIASITKIDRLNELPTSFTQFMSLCFGRHCFRLARCSLWLTYRLRLCECVCGFRFVFLLFLNHQSSVIFTLYQQIVVHSMHNKFEKKMKSTSQRFAFVAWISFICEQIGAFLMCAVLTSKWRWTIHSKWMRKTDKCFLCVVVVVNFVQLYGFSTYLPRCGGDVPMQIKRKLISSFT